MKIDHEMRFAGIKLKNKTSNRDGQSSIDCGNLWQKFESDKVAFQIMNKRSNDVYAVYFNYDGDYMDPFDYFIGCMIPSDAVIADHLSEIRIPPAHYQKFMAQGKMPESIGKKWTEIWQSDIERAYTFDFESYGSRSHDWENAEVGIFISIKD
ncbi:MAG: GyrI-like domain-containing protein [Bacteroidia bacterium]|nr:GyrI-like domain-containing protein [Bacteroidia bacterium]